MKRRKRKSIRIDNSEQDQIQLPSNFKKDCQLIQYNEAEYTNPSVDKVEDLVFYTIKDKVSWLNIYGFQYHNSIRQIIKQNNIDEFIAYLTVEVNHRNKAIELPDCFFFSVKSLYLKPNSPDLN